MADFTLKDVTFSAHEADGEHDEAFVRCHLFKRYYADVPCQALERVGQLVVHTDRLEFPGASEKRAYNKAGLVVGEALRHDLVHQLYGKKAYYITSERAIPLLGSNEFGVVDRGSNIIEVKPLTGCNFNCIYCSVDEGENKKLCDYLVERSYLVSVVAEVAATKQHPVEVNIGPHGEPLLYPELVELVRDLQGIPHVSVVSVNTNGALLSKKLVDDLIVAGLTRINLSLPALDEELAAKLAGIPRFPLAHLKEMLAYAVRKGLAVLLAPVVIPGLNEEELPGIVSLSKTYDSPYPKVGIQNFLEYPRGRTPKGVRAWSWDRFNECIKTLEVETGVDLSMSKEDFGIHDEEELVKPFKKGRVVTVELVLPGRYKNEFYGAASGRVVAVQTPNTPEALGRRLRVKLVRDKHNIFKGVPVGKR